MPQVFIGLGSNLGDSLARLREAASALSSLLDDVRLSGVYETEPMYVVDQPKFLNAALCGSTSLSPLGLLGKLKELEQKIGRQQRERNAPREIDIDLVAYGSLDYRYEDHGHVVLQVPHPRTFERRFVLLPLADLDPSLVLPHQGQISDLIMATESQSESVRLVGQLS